MSPATNTLIQPEAVASFAAYVRATNDHKFLRAAEARRHLERCGVVVMLQSPIAPRHLGGPDDSRTRSPGEA